jgi:hypothetical protein
MQTENFDGYVKALNWLKNTLPLSPKYITTDFEPALILAVKQLYPTSLLVPCFFHFAKCLWLNASRWGLRKSKVLLLAKQLIFSLKALAFRAPTKVFKHFSRIKEKYSAKFLTFLEYFEHTWMDGTFKIKDWNYHDKLQQFEDLAVTNNGLESFHQMIRSQMVRKSPNLCRLIDVLARVEMMKKVAYEEDRVKGDPMYNRCWPASKIFRELYSKEAKKEEVSENEETDYGYEDLQKLKQKDFHSYFLKLKTVESEMDFLFQEFDEENMANSSDQTLLDTTKAFKKLKKQCELKNLINDPESLVEEQVINARLQILDQLEIIKMDNMSNTRTEAQDAKSCISKNEYSELAEENPDIKKIIDGELCIKSLSSYRKEM